MRARETTGVRSTAQIMGHPIHPMLIPFPIGLVTAGLVTDVVYWITGRGFWAQASFWLLLGGLVTGLLAAVFGATDLFTIPAARSLRIGWAHGLGNVAAMLLTAVNVWIRLGNRTEYVLPWGIVLSAITVGILTVTGWLGGELVYRHLIGVTGPDD